MYTADRLRCTIASAPLGNGLTRLQATKSLQGDAIWLPYEQNKITSVRLPHRPQSIKFFCTDNMSGCKFFVDKVSRGREAYRY